MILPCKRNNFLMRFEISNMLVHFTTRVPDTSDTSATRAARVQHKWDMSNMSATRVLHERHKYNMSATRTTLVWHEWKILITRRVKTFSHTYTSYMVWLMKDYKEGSNLILRTTFQKNLVPMPKCVWKVHHKNWTL